MCPACAAKADKIAELAGFFREKAGETKELAFVAMMRRAAADLERLAASYRARCRCADEVRPSRSRPVRPARRSSSVREDSLLELASPREPGEC